MQQAHNQFGTNVGRARDLLALYTTLSATTTGALDLTDILRTAIVVAVSAFDHLVHEIARIGMLEIYDEQASEDGGIRAVFRNDGKRAYGGCNARKLAMA